MFHVTDMYNFFPNQSIKPKERFQLLILCKDTNRRTFFTAFYNWYQIGKRLCVRTIIERVEHTKIKKRRKELIIYLHRAMHNINVK